MVESKASCTIQGHAQSQRLGTVRPGYQVPGQRSWRGFRRPELYMDMDLEMSAPPPWSWQSYRQHRAGRLGLVEQPSYHEVRLPPLLLLPLPTGTAARLKGTMVLAPLLRSCCSPRICLHRWL